MADCRKQSSRECSLLDLPDPVIETIAAVLAANDRTRFMAVCRKAAFVTVQAADTTLKITKDTKFPGIKKVLNSLPGKINLKVKFSCGQLEDIEPGYDKPLPALGILMGLASTKYITHIASKCCWECITKVTIKGKAMRCLLPPLIAMSCPQLTHLTIVRHDFEPFGAFTDAAADALPLTLCTSLTHLELFAYEPTALQLPPAHHSPAELRQSLPNINSLIMRDASADVLLLEAFATQLTRLHIDHVATAAEQWIRRCSNLVQLNVTEFILPDNPGGLKNITLGGFESYSEEVYGRLLQLPSLTTVQFDCELRIKNDWSGHACSWQELYLSDMQFTKQGLLSVKAFGN